MTETELEKLESAVKAKEEALKLKELELRERALRLREIELEEEEKKLAAKENEIKERAAGMAKSDEAEASAQAEQGEVEAPLEESRAERNEIEASLTETRPEQDVAQENETAAEAQEPAAENAPMTATQDNESKETDNSVKPLAEEIKHDVVVNASIEEKSTAINPPVRDDDKDASEKPEHHDENKKSDVTAETHVESEQTSAAAETHAEQEQSDTTTEHNTDAEQSAFNPEPPPSTKVDEHAHSEIPLSEDPKDLQEKVAALGDDDFTRKKKHHKVIRTLFEFCVLGCLVFIIINAFFTLTDYEPFPDDAASTSTDTGFIAISYFGVDRIGDTSTLIGRDRLYEHLDALKNQGYVTITQQDIEKYYTEGKPLPKRALYLMFEDGRRDTGIFAQKILEQLNYKATMMTYPENFGVDNPKFLQPKELRELLDTSYWEMGTNGYRLEYINVFDRYDNYIGEIDPLRFAMVRPYLGRRYNHYLMDYLRDEHGVPRESYRHMKARLDYDYERLRDLYDESIGYVPSAHVLMHANTGKFGNTNDTSEINEKWIRELFAMNFNREGYSFNNEESSIYDLTRMQPQPYWPVNHLLMRIKHDINQPITFEKGDKRRWDDWTLMSGAAEIDKECLTLTTDPESLALAKLNGSDSDAYKDISVSVEMLGNAFGAQTIFMRADDDLSRYVAVSLINDQLIIKEKANGAARELYREKLPVILGEEIKSVEEVRRDAEVTENQAFARYAPSPEAAKEYMARAEKRKAEPAAKVSDGAEPFESVQSFHRRADHVIHVTMSGDKINVTVDDAEAVSDLAINDTTGGAFMLCADWRGEAWSQRNLNDDVYDGVFDHLIISSATDDTKLFSMELEGWPKYKQRAIDVWESILNVFLYRI